MSSPTQIDARALIERYESFLIDAYGVLVDGRGALSGAAEFIETLRAEGRAFSVVTNDASRLETSCARRYQALGIQIHAHEVLTSGSMILGTATSFVPSGRR